MSIKHAILYTVLITALFFIKSSYTQIFEPSSKIWRSGRSNNGTLTMALLLHGTPAQLRSVSRESILNSLWAIQKIDLSLGKKLILWDILKGNQTVIELQRDTFEKAGNLLLSMPESDFYNINVSDWDVVDFFGSLKELSRRQAGIIAYALKNKFGHNIVENPESLNRIKGLICGFSPQDLRTITAMEISELGADVFDNIRPCTLRQKKVLLQIAMEPTAYGPPQSWNEEDTDNLGLLITAMDKDTLRQIKPDALVGINPGTIEALTKEQLARLTKTQLEYLSDLSLTAYKKVIGLPSHGQIVLDLRCLLFVLCLMLYLDIVLS